MLWSAYLYDPKTRKETLLGNVRAENTPAALLRAYKKFKIPGPKLPYVGARRVKPLPTPKPFSPEDIEAARAMTKALNSAFRKM